MKKNIQHVVVDLEFTPIPSQHKDKRKICTQEIIEIGAVKTDSKCRIKDEFRIFVKPDFSPLDPRCSHLTGIKTYQLADAVCFAEAMQQFSDWVGDKKTEFYQWSEGDLAQFTAECRLKDLYETHINILEADWIDVQAEFDKQTGLKNSFSLESAINMSGLEPIGKLHDALYDACNTAEVLRVISNPDEVKKVSAYVKSWCLQNEKPTEQTTTLGDLFAGLFTDNEE